MTVGRQPKPKAKIIAYEPAHEAAVRALNGRLKAGGSIWGFYEVAQPVWLSGANAIAERRYLLSVDPHGTVRGGVVVKTQMFKLDSIDRALLTWQGPVSEGLIDRTHANVGAKLLMSLRDEGLPIFAWGGSEQLAPLILAMGWDHYPTPLLIKFIKPYRIARGAPFLRTSALRRCVLNVVAESGLAVLAGGLVTAALRLKHRPQTRTARAILVPSFGDWANDIWTASRDSYRVIALRDRLALERVTGSWPNVEIYRVERDGETIGWAVLLVTQMNGDKRFGDLTTGTIIDALSLPGEEAATAAAADEVLKQRGVDIIVVNLTHQRWLDAFAATGYLRFNGQRALYIGEELRDLLAETAITPPHDIHLMPIDGDGPLGL